MLRRVVGKECQALYPVALALMLTGCAGRRPPAPPVTQAPQPTLHRAIVSDDHVPPFANAGWESFSRAEVVAIALREWRLFGQPVHDEDPASLPPPLPENKPERQPGLWERIGEYWWISQDPGSVESAWTGIHDEQGRVFEAGQDGFYAWSAAFISYVMRIAGAGADFPYSPNHSTYINAAASGASKLLHAYPPQSYAPLAGDLICTGRGQAAALRFTDLPTEHAFTSHCDIVAAVAPGQLSVIGGNVEDAVSLKHVPISATGLLAAPDGTILDPRYPWLTVLKVTYDR